MNVHRLVSILNAFAHATTDWIDAFLDIFEFISAAEAMRTGATRFLFEWDLTFVEIFYLGFVHLVKSTRKETEEKFFDHRIRSSASTL